MTNESPTNRLPEHDVRPEDTLVFLHIPKTGGVTLGALIDPMWLPGARCPEYLTFPLARLPRDTIAGYRSFVGHFSMYALRQLVGRDFQCITMLREPVNRHISFLNMLKRMSAHASEPGRLPLLFQIGNPLIFQILQSSSQGDSQSLLRAWRSSSMEKLIEDRDLQRMQGLINTQTMQLSPVKFSAIGAYPAGADSTAEDWFRQAKESLLSMACFGLMERFQESLLMLSYVFGWQPLLDVIRHNESPRETDSPPLSSRSLEQLSAYNEFDLRLYAFARDEFERRFLLMNQMLLDRYGSRAQAHSQLPLAMPELVDLLECHYRRRFQQRRSALKDPQGSSRFSFASRAESATGWQRCETAPVHGTFRWTGPGSKASIDLPRPDGENLRVRVSVIAASRPQFLERLRLQVNQRQLPWECHVEPSGETVFETRVPAGLASQEPFLRLELETGDVAPLPAPDPDQADPRLLGVAVKWIECLRDTETNLMENIL